MKENEVEKFNDLKRKFKAVKARDQINKVLMEPSPKYIWHGIQEGSVGLITGVAKTGKTTFCENLAISLAVGRNEFFGFNLEGKPRKVIFINLEESYRLRCRRNSKQVQLLTPEEELLFSENYMTTPEDFIEFVNDKSDWEILREIIIDSGAEIIFIDSLTHMFSGKIEDSSAGRKFTEKCKKYLFSLNKTIIIVHHNVKGNDKPVDQDSIAGGRVISQTFEYGYCLANIPREFGGNYLCMVFNKHLPKDDTKAYLYKLDSNGWFENLGIENKFKLYKEDSKIDGRVDNTNSNLIYDFIKNQYNQGNQTISTSTLKSQFVTGGGKKMSNDTLHKGLGKLMGEGVVKKISQGTYELNGYESEEGRR